jgi:hypothetical protein
MRYRHTRHQVPRGALPDAETHNRVFLIKNVSLLHATYQVRLLAFNAGEMGKKLVLRVPEACKLGPSLAALRREQPNLILVERV